MGVGLSSWSGEPSAGCAGALQRAQRAFDVDDVGVRVAAVDPGERLGGGVPAGDQGGDVELAVAEPADDLVHRAHGLDERVVAAAGGSQCAERHRPKAGRGGAGAGAVGDRQPCPVAVFDEVEPVAADLVGGQ